jgi:carbon-monoxide dehydrogenase large subunit
VDTQVKTRLIGQPVRRREDRRFLTGRGRYVADLQVMGAAHIAFLRSPHAHARIRRLSCKTARAMPGVLLCLTGQDWATAGLGILPCLWGVAFSDGRPMNEATRPALVRGEVRHLGDTIAAVVAETRDQALDAVEAIDVDYEILPGVVETARAASPEAPLVHPRFGSNLAFEVDWGDREAAARGMQRASHVTRLELVNNRVAPAPLEPRALVGVYERNDDCYTLWAQSQNPHLLRLWLANDSLKVPEHKIRVISPDVGGGYGQKVCHYPEEPVVLWAARLLGRPVRWLATRAENLIVDAQARDHVTSCALALDGDQRICSLQVDTVANLGAYVIGFGAGIPGYFYVPLITGLYDIPAVYCRVRAVYTNTTPTDAYRGAGRPEATYVIERLVEKAAHELGIDVCQLRSRNFVQPHQFPYRNAVGTRYDSGNFPGLLARVAGAGRYEALRADQRRRQGGPLHLGIGLSGFVDSAGGANSRMAAKLGRRLGGYDAALVRVHPTAKVSVFCGAHSHGQGHSTTFAQLVADRLGVPLDDVDIIEGDTASTPFGHGTYGSRSLSVVGIAIVKATDKVIAKGLKIAAHLLESAEPDVEFANGRFIVRGTDRRVDFAEVVRAAYRLDNYPDDLDPGLEETAFYDPPGRNTPSAMHLCAVEVDTETGAVAVREFHTVDDVGRIINPLIVEGQIQGGLAQGIGQALLECCAYDRDGQLLTGSFMDYAMPRADQLPAFRSSFQETLSPDNPLGVKGAGESGTIGAPAAVVNAVVDALWDLGVRHIDMPLTPARVRQAISEAGRQAE